MTYSYYVIHPGRTTKKTLSLLSIRVVAWLSRVCVDKPFDLASAPSCYSVYLRGHNAIAAESQISHLVPLNTSRTSSKFAMESSTRFGDVGTKVEWTGTGARPSQRNVSSNVPCVSFTNAS
mgnify:CR=1 FL=1